MPASVRGSGRPARPIKRKATPMAGRDAGCPAGWAAPESPLANFGSVSSAAGCEVARKVSGAAGARGLPQNARPPAGPALQPPKTNGAEAPGNAAAFRASAPEENKEHNKEHTKRDKENHMSRAGGPQATRRPAVTEPPRPPAGTEKRWPARPDRAVLQPTRRLAVAGPPRPPAGTEKRGPARRNQAVLQPPTAWRWRARPGRPPGQRRGGRPAPTGRCFNPPAAWRWRNRPGRPPGQRRGGPVRRS